MPHLRLVGTAGYVEGETHVVELGDQKVIGRSRACDISLRKTLKWLKSGKLETEAEREFRSVSRRHAAVRFLTDGKVQVESLGRNGTFLDGVRVEQVTIRDLPKRTYVLRLGPVETFRIEWVPGDPDVSAQTIVQSDA